LGERFLGRERKQFCNLAGKPVIIHVLERLIQYRLLNYISLVLPKTKPSSVVIPTNSDVIIKVVEGGIDRNSSVENGMKALPIGVKWVVIHDGVRPLLTKNLLERCLLEADDTGASLAAFPVSDTLKRSDESLCTFETISRENLWSAQTPQVVRRDLLEKAFKEVERQEPEITDESTLLEKIGIRTRVVFSTKTNLKITTEEDLMFAEFYLREEKNVD